MKLWRLLPKDKDRSENRKRSLYDGSYGAVIVRAQSGFDARALAAEEFEQEAASAGGTLKSPWLQEDDTTVEPCEDAPYPSDGEATVLRPTRDGVTGPDG